MAWSGSPVHCALILAAALGLGGCQNTQSNFEGTNFSDDTRALEKELNAEATALGTAQGVAGIAAASDPTGLSGMALGAAGLATRNALMTSADSRMKAQLARDEQAAYRRYGMNPDGTPSGKKPTGG